MPLKLIKCKEQFIDCFCDNLKQEGYNLGSLKGSLDKGLKRKVLVGKVVKVFSIISKSEYAVIVLKEYLPSQEYGEHFKAVIHNELVDELTKVNPQIGDRLAFLSPAVFLNPAFRKKYNRFEPKYSVDFGVLRNSLMWFTKKEYLTNHANLNNVTNPTATSIINNNQPKSKTSALRTFQDKSSNHHVSICLENSQLNKPRKVVSKNHLDVSEINKKDRKQNINMAAQNASVRTRQNLKVNGSKAQAKSVEYSYKSLAVAKSEAESGDPNRVHVIGVVFQILKTLTTTSTGKFTIIIKLIDESTNCSVDFKVHCFTHENTILKQIEQGDVLRLHRIKMELFNNVADGRIFNSCDITLFKKTSGESITHAKNTVINQKEKDRVKELMQWYKNEIMPWLLNDIVSLSSFVEEIEHKNILCQVVSDPTVMDNKVVLEITDGTNVNQLTPSSPLQGVKDIVTRVNVYQMLNEFKKLKAGSYVLLYNVNAIRRNKKISLVINKEDAMYYVIGEDVDQVQKIKRRIEDNDCNENRSTCGSKGETLINNTQKSPAKSNQNVNSENEEPEDANHAPSGSNELFQKSETVVVQANQTVNNQSEEKTNSARVLRKRVSPQQTNAEVKSKNVSMLPKRKRKNSNDQNNVHKGIIVGKPAEGASGKSLKSLYTLDNGNWSDATDEISEASQPDKHSEANSIVVNHANQSMSEILGMVTTKICCKEYKSNTLSPANMKDKTIPSSGGDRTNEPFVLLSNILEVNSRNHDGDGRENQQHGSTDRTKGLSLKDNTKSLEELEVASTIINDSYKRSSTRIKNSKRPRLNSDSTVLRAEESLSAIEILPSTTEKVSRWFHQPERDPEPDALDSKYYNTILLGDDDESVDVSSLLTSNKKHLRVFLLEIIPNPDRNPTDLISGFCHSGCKGLYLSSLIHWQEIEGEDIPLCPMCIKLNLEKSLELMFTFELCVLGTDGCIFRVLLIREHAQFFFNCDVREFVQNSAVRKSRLELLNDCMLENSKHKKQAPVMDISVSFLKNLLCVVNTRLKLPTNVN